MSASFSVEILDEVDRFEPSERVWLEQVVVCAAGCLQRDGDLDEAVGSLTVSLVDEATICTLHDQYFDDPTVTDVITFPAGDPWFDGDAHLGDVAICAEVAEEQAALAKHDTMREVAFLAIHGLLHLSGHDDTTDEERNRMLKRQSELLDACAKFVGELPF